MSNVIRLSIGAFAAALAMVGITAGTASASNVSTNGCTQNFVDYTPNAGGGYHVNYVRARNVCGAFAGHFQIVTVNSADTNPIQTFQVTINQNVPQNSSYCATGWRLNSPGNYTNMGTACTFVV